MITCPPSWEKGVVVVLSIDGLVVDVQMRTGMPLHTVIHCAPHEQQKQVRLEGRCEDGIVTQNPFQEVRCMVTGPVLHKKLSSGTST